MIYKLSQICNMQSGGTPRRGSSEYYGGDIPWIKISDFKDGLGGIVTKTEETITREGLKSINNRLFEKGTLLLAMYGSVGKTAFTGIQASCNQAILGITAKDENQLNLKYLKYWFDLNQGNLVNQGRGVTLNNISLDIVKKQEIDLPDLERQNKIVAILDKASALVQKRQTTIELLDLLLKSQFLEMFGDPGFNPKKWDIKSFEDHIEYIGDIGSNGSNAIVAKNLKMSDEEDYALMVRTTNLKANDFSNNTKYVSRKTYDFFSKSKVFGGEIIMNKIGSAGEFWIMPNLDRPVSLGLNQLIIRTKNINRIFVFYYYSTDYGKGLINSKVQGAVTKSITKTAVKSLPLFVPPEKLQDEFALIVNKIERLKEKLNSDLLDLNNLLGALSQKAFNGSLTLDVTLELNALLEEIDFRKPENDLFSIITNEEYLLSLVYRLNNQEFETQDLYDKAKHATFQLLKTEEILTQEYDETTKSLRLKVK